MALLAHEGITEEGEAEDFPVLLERLQQLRRQAVSSRLLKRA